MIDVWGVDRPGLVSKADRKRAKAKEPPPTGGRIITGALFPVAHGAVAGKPVHKLRAAGYELGGGMVIPGPIGAGAGTYLAHTQGHYKRQDLRKVNKMLTVTGVAHGGFKSMRAVERVGRHRADEARRLAARAKRLPNGELRVYRVKPDSAPVAKSSADKDAAALLRRGLKFAKPKPIKPTGPGSLRGRMDPSTAHWPSAAHRGEGSIHKMTTRQSVEGPVVAVREAASGARRKVKQQWMKLDQGVQPLLIGGSSVSKAVPLARAKGLTELAGADVRHAHNPFNLKAPLTRGPGGTELAGRGQRLPSSVRGQRKAYRRKVANEADPFDFSQYRSQ